MDAACCRRPLLVWCRSTADGWIDADRIASSDWVVGADVARRLLQRVALRLRALRLTRAGIRAVNHRGAFSALARVAR